MTQRLFVPDDLATGRELAFDKDQSHYLSAVLRLKIGAEIHVFNGRDGVYSVGLTKADKKGVHATIGLRLEVQRASMDLKLYAAPIKGYRWDYVIEKATELGVSAICPIVTQHTVVRKLNHSRMRATAVEASEQCRRHDVPKVDGEIELQTLLDDVQSGREETRIYFWADEGGEPDTPSLSKALASCQKAPLGLIVGPEGGFSATERSQMTRIERIKPVTLGPRVLRADTAVFSMLAIVQSTVGDWNPAES
jgi:16S rRNA (uracil1498-N3)-methyltransferase